MIIHDVTQNSPEWKQVRAGIPTASAFSKLVSGTGKHSISLEEYARILGIEMYTGEPEGNFRGNKHTRRGHELEPEAVNEYAFRFAVEVQEVGFITDDKMTMGASPDRLIGNNGVLEIKCLSSEEHLALLEYYDKRNDIPPKYKPQLQGEMLIAERAWNDIYFYHPKMPSLCHRVEPDHDYLNALNLALQDCLKERDRVHQFLTEFGFTGELAPPLTKDVPLRLRIEI